VVIADDLTTLHANIVVARGKVIAESGKLTIELPECKYPDWVVESVHIGHPLRADDFRLVAPMDGNFTANVIGIIENQAPTRHLRIRVTARSGEIHVDMGRDIAKVAVVERHNATGRIQVGLVNGFGFNVSCAIATTVAHDSHHMIVVGTSEQDMAMAANELTRLGGGQIVIREGKVIGQVELPIAGLMSNERADVVARKAGSVLAGFIACGCKLNNPNMQLSLLALVVIPDLRLSDLGLVDVTRFEFIPVLE
jgi:adenine deaminase